VVSGRGDEGWDTGSAYDRQPLGVGCPAVAKSASTTHSTPDLVERLMDLVVMTAAAADGVATREHENPVEAVQDAMWQAVCPQA